MKYIKLYFILFLFVFVSNVQTFSQKPIANDPNRIYYWFAVNVRIDNKTDSYKVTSTSSELYAGTLKEFEKDLWKSLSNRKIVVGPFLEKNEALNAKRLYRSSEDKVKLMPVDTVPAIVHWFAIDFKQSDRMFIYIIVRNPAATQSGPEKRFIDAFYEQLNYKHFAIGPFYSYDHAEFAKRLYRKNE